ncbi:MAG: hypothetical protein ACYC4U_24165 [Pirellulaceae bacterium]
MTSRCPPIDFLTASGNPATHPLKWALPDSYDSLPAPRLLKRLTRFATRKKVPPAAATRLLQEWLFDAEIRPRDAIWALECLAWCHLLRGLTAVVPGELWHAAYNALRTTVESSAAINLHDDPLRHQLLTGELPLALAYNFPELQDCGGLVLPASQSVSLAMAELLDGEGMPHAAYLQYFRGLLACWTRCFMMGEAAGWKCCDHDACLQYEWIVRQALRLSRPDGTLIFSQGLSGDWCPALLRAALEQGGNRRDWQIARQVLPGPFARSGHRRAGKFSECSAHSEWGEICVMRSKWSRKSPQFACLFHGDRLCCEVTTEGRTLWSGDTTPVVKVDDRPLAMRSEWTETCWFTDEDVDYLELEVDCQDGWQIQRQMLLARRDRFLFIADAVLGPQPAFIQYQVRFPLAEGMHFEPEGETREGLLGNHRAISAVLPLSLPEWRAAPALGTLQAEGDAVQLAIAEKTPRLYVPVLFDLAPRRVPQRRTWRQLTVAEHLEAQPRHVAAGYRVQLDNRQWLIYRSLAPRSNRTVLGQNLANEFVAARFDLDGGLEELIEIE